MRKPNTFFLLMMAVFAVSGADAQVIAVGEDTSVTFEVVGGAEVIRVAVAEVRLQPVIIEQQPWAMVEVPGGHNLMRRGEPALPFLFSEFLLGADDRISLELVSVNEHEIDLAANGYAGVVPSKGHFDRDQDPETIPFVFASTIYGSGQSNPGEFYPGVRQWVDEPFIAGPLRGQAMRFPVASWRSESNRLRVIKQATFRVIRSPDQVNPRTGNQPALTGFFDQMARLRAVNYEGSRTQMVEAGRLLILTHDSFYSNVQPLADWESLVGYPTILTALSAIPHNGASPTLNDIRNYIQGLYDTGLTWIILVGDYEQIPNPWGVYEGAPCDACYTKLDGNDNRPDAVISRISAQNPAEVDVQVAKILTYERYPDTGSAATWYHQAFGVASGDTGGTGVADWQRMNWLRDDLLAYTYSEFAELYTSPSATEVADAVLNGTSLGMYIGHGTVSGWVTSGFDTTDVDNLTNGSMLPIIWDVACDNGAFHYADACFAEAWMRKQGGGAVSFEAATTNESWVPPCDAQRGIIDAFRLEAAFTTGGQHVNGKNYCMDINGDSDSSEGTRFMEQSTLFGSCLTWPRTIGAVAPDEPQDFQLSGGQATLTVTIGGQPYTKANGAIVSFYADTEANVLGSGLINSSGVVTAALSGDPTHCHIHGSNLIPTAYRLGARPAGQILLDQEVYWCTDTVGIMVADSNVGASAVNITLATPSGQATVILTEDSPGGDVYSGAYHLGSAFVVADGETLIATYHDADIGDGSSRNSYDTATIECTSSMFFSDGFEAGNLSAWSAVQH